MRSVPVPLWDMEWYKYFDEVNREPVVYHWKYKMDEISEEEAVSI